MHVEACAGIEGERSAYDEGIEDDIGFLSREGEIIFLGASAAFMADTDGVLAVGLEEYVLRGAGTEMKMQEVFDEDRIVAAGLVFFGQTDEDKEAVTAIDDDIRQAREVGFAVDVDAEDLAFLEPYAVDRERVSVAVIDHELQGCTALLREDGVEREGVRGERQTQCRVIAHLILLTGGESKE